MAKKEFRTYGLIVEAGKFADSPAVYAKVVTKDPKDAFPTWGRSDGENAIWDAGPKHEGLMIANLEIFVWKSTYGDSWADVHVEYRGMYSASYRDVQMMAATLKKIHKQIEKDNAIEAGDVIMSVAKALNLTFYAETSNGQKWTGTSSHYDWRYSEVSKARDVMRRLIREASEKAA